MAWLALDEKSDITSSLRKESTPMARLDPRGCIVTSDGVEVELTTNGDLWTTNACPSSTTPFGSGATAPYT
jgi:hypothetical protein